MAYTIPECDKGSRIPEIVPLWDAFLAGLFCVRYEKTERHWHACLGRAMAVDLVDLALIEIQRAGTRGLSGPPGMPLLCLASKGFSSR